MFSARVASVFCCVGFLLGVPAIAARAECTGHPNAIGTSRVITVEPSAYPKVGKAQYSETLPLQRREVVFTFNGGPEPPYTDRILGVLADECVRATFFISGSNAQDTPDLVRRAFVEGHVIGVFGFSDEPLDSIPFESATLDIEKGIAAIKEALGDAGYVSPYFRAPELALTSQLLRHIIKDGFMVWSVDTDSEDWKDPTEEQLVRQTVERLEKVGKGILQMHDKPVTARALPSLLAELKRRGFRIVHVAGTPYSAPTEKTRSGNEEERVSQTKARGKH